MYRSNESRAAFSLTPALFFTLFLSLCLASTAQAQPFYPDFEIDADAYQDGSADDWENVYDDTDDALTSVFIPESIEGNGVDGTVLPANGESVGVTGGGSTDTNDIDQWIIDFTPNLQNKNEIQNAYAAAYLCPAGGRADCNEDDLIVYLGADRHAFNGSAQLGFWLIRGDLVIVDDGNNTGHLARLAVDGRRRADLDELRATGSCRWIMTRAAPISRSGSTGGLVAS